MALRYTRPPGTQDILPQDSWKWRCAERRMRETAELYGYREVRLPTFESTEVFSRGVGEGTDIVSKEMYTFSDKGGRSITLRPEGTAGTVRAVLENGLLASAPLPLKCYYIQSCFRCEKPQKGRFREFHQLGAECYGTHEAAADAEVMALARDVLRAVGLGGSVRLEINSIGCGKCRPKYLDALRGYFAAHRDKLCENCAVRLDTNPMRLLDCKEDSCKEIASNAPLTTDYLCEDCANHFQEVRALLAEAEMPYAVNPRIVRGLDYYTNTVFEFSAAGIGAQGVVCGGGRYDALIEQFGGMPTPAVGFGMGLERLLMLAEQNGRLPRPPAGPALFAAALGGAGRAVARRLARSLREADIPAECDLAGRSVKSQMKAAGRLGALYAVVIGEDEAQSGIARLRRMSDGSEAELPIVRIASALKYMLRLDPLAEGGGVLDELVRESGPVANFDDDGGQG